MNHAIEIDYHAGTQWIDHVAVELTRFRPPYSRRDLAIEAHGFERLTDPGLIDEAVVFRIGPRARGYAWRNRIDASRFRARGIARNRWELPAGYWRVEPFYWAFRNDGFAPW